MSDKLTLSHRVYFDAAFTELCRTIGWVGFPARELSQHVRHLVGKHGVKKVSAALSEVATFGGNRVALNRDARKVCGMLLGPEPDKQVAFYKDCKPEYRPRDWDKPPVIPPGGPDPLMESLYRLSVLDLDGRLKQARQHDRLHPDEPPEAGAVESELIRRGMDIPPEDTPEELAPPVKPKKARKKKG